MNRGTVRRPRGFQPCTVFLLACAACSPVAERDVRYPDTRMDSTVDEYHGTRVAVPYRWLEDIDSEETRAWVAAQHRVAGQYLEGLPGRAYFLDRLRTLLEAEEPALPQKQGPYWVTREVGPDGRDAFRVRDSLDEPARVLLDPTALSPDGDPGVSSAIVSPDGRYVAYTVVTGGGDLMEIRIRDREHDRDLPDRIPGIKLDAPHWTADGRGLIYERFLKPGNETADGIDRDGIIAYHAIGSSLEQDRVLFRSDPDDVGALAWVDLSADGRFVVITEEYGFEYAVWALDLGNPHAPDFGGALVPLTNGRDGRNIFEASHGATLYLKTTRGAPNGRLVAVEMDAAARERTILPETEHVLQEVRVVGNRLVATYLQDVKSAMAVYDLDGNRLRDVTLPAIGSVFDLSGASDEATFTFGFESFVHPPATYRHDVHTGETALLAAREIGADRDRYVTQQVFFASKDGTRVPMFITHRRDLARDGSIPTLLWGYGAPAVIDPDFRDHWFTWIEAGGILAVANVRGGTEYGETWRRAGLLADKQNTFDDFISAAEYLIHEGYTSPDNLAINGLSHGGMLVGAVMTQRPDLFAAALPVVGVLDPLRFPLFTAGPRLARDIGDPAIPAQFDWLYAWSPLHNLRDGTCYPATLVMTAVDDDVVHPSQSYTFAARLQAAQACDRPALLRVYPAGAHYFVRTPSHVQEIADLLAFAAHHTGLVVPPR